MEHTRRGSTTERSTEPPHWERVQRLYAFCRARAIERLVFAAQDPPSLSKHRRELHVLESMYCKARQHHDIVVDCAVTYFRTQALREANHPDFLADWI